MKNILIILKHEIRTTLQRRSFWVMTFLFPLIVVSLSVGSQVIGGSVIEEAQETASSVEQFKDGKVVGYVDDAKIIKKFPEDTPEKFFRPYKDEVTARKALETGELHQVYLIPEDFLASGEFILIDDQFQPLRSTSNAEIFERILLYNLVQQDPLGRVLINPTPKINNHPLAPTSDRDEDDPFQQIVPYTIMFVFFFIITSSGSMFLNSVTREKENLTAEVLLLSLEPREMMIGKVLGLGLVALLQMGFWMVGGLFSLDRANQMAVTAEPFQLPAGFVVWALLFFLLGYFMYASALGAVGVLAPNAREGGKFTFLVVFPLLIPIWFNVAFTETPNGPLPTFLSLFPLTAPSAMMTRLAITEVPPVQILLSLLGVILAAYLFIVLASRLFRPDNLLSRGAFSWKRLVKALQG